MTRAQRLGEYVRALEAVAEAAGGLEHVSRLRGKLEVPQDVNQLLAAISHGVKGLSRDDIAG